MEEKLKQLLKTLKFNEQTISTFLGFAVVLMVVGMLVNYFRTTPAVLPPGGEVLVGQTSSMATVAADLTDIIENEPSEPLEADQQPVAAVDQAEDEAQLEPNQPIVEVAPKFAGSLPATYQVKADDTLWSIAEQHYLTGYGWSEIAQANSLDNPRIIDVGQEITIPQLAKAYPQTVIEPGAVLEMGGSNQDQVAKAEPEPQLGPASSVAAEPIEGENYLVQKGDNLWNIAVRAYADGYRWPDIGRENGLMADPGYIEVNQELHIPR
jgi:nucleoid-associated protein YgaU